MQFLSGVSSLALAWLGVGVTTQLHQVGEILALFSRGCVWVCVMFGDIWCVGPWLSCGLVLFAHEALYAAFGAGCMWRMHVLS
jgi:hypothetical protein